MIDLFAITKLVIRRDHYELFTPRERDETIKELADAVPGLIAEIEMLRKRVLPSDLIERLHTVATLAHGRDCPLDCRHARAYAAEEFVKEVVKELKVERGIE